MVPYTLLFVVAELVVLCSALTRLQAEGVLVIRTGRGAFVKSPDAPPMADRLNAYIL